MRVKIGFAYSTPICVFVKAAGCLPTIWPNTKKVCPRTPRSDTKKKKFSPRKTRKDAKEQEEDLCPRITLIDANKDHIRAIRVIRGQILHSRPFAFLARKELLLLLRVPSFIRGQRSCSVLSRPFAFFAGKGSYSLRRRLPLRKIPCPPLSYKTNK